MSLAEVEGQDQAVGALRRALQSGRLHHAWLFAGPDGVGKALTAFGVAMALLCEQPQAGDACGTCHSCRRMAERQHPDLHIIERGTKADGRPEQAIKIEQVRTLQQALSFKSFEGRRRVVVLLEAERMNPATANALLKTLEEPGPGTHFLVVTAAAHLLLPTILSRCQRVRFGALDRAVVARHIAKITEKNAAESDLLAGLSEGSISKGVALAKSTVLEQRGPWLDLLGFHQPLGAVPALLDLAEQLAGTNEELPFALHLLRTFYRDLLLAQQGFSAEAFVHRDLAALIAERARQATQRQVLDAIDALNETEHAILNRSGNARLFLERLLCRLAGVADESAA